MAQPRVIVLIGLPGSGKSTWLAARALPALSSDAVRRLLWGEENDQRDNARVFAALRCLLRQRLAIGMPATYMDATHLRPWERRPYFPLAKRYGATVEALFFDVPLEVCLERNRRRERVVPEETVRAMAARLIAPSLEEGFARITRVGE